MKVCKMLCTAGVVAATALTPISAVQAQDYPSRPLEWVVPFPAGGTMDPIVRMLAEAMHQDFGQPIIVDNKPGAGTRIGVNHVVRSKPDGHTAITVANSFTINPSLYPDLAYDTKKDLEAVALLGATPNILVGHSSLKPDTLQELVDYAKANPGTLSYASFGVGTSAHLAGEMLKGAAGIDLLHVPYKGGAPAMQDLLGGRVDLMIQNLPNVLQHLENGTLKAYGVTSLTRAELAPAIPTIAEQGYPDFTTNSWYGVLVPAGTDPSIITTLNKTINKGLEAKKAQLAKMGFEVMPGDPKQLADLIDKDIALNAQIVKESGIKIE